MKSHHNTLCRVPSKRPSIGHGLVLILAGGLLSMAISGCSFSTQSSASTTSAPKATATPLLRVGSSSSVPQTEAERFAERAITSAGPAIVEVMNVGVGLGSGVILTKDGYIVTNNHVVANGNRY